MNNLLQYNCQSKWIKQNLCSSILAFKECILLLEGEMKTNVCERCNSRSVGKKEGNNKNHKCIHMYNYTSEKSYKMVSSNANLRGEKKSRKIKARRGRFEKQLKVLRDGKSWLLQPLTPVHRKPDILWCQVLFSGLPLKDQRPLPICECFSDNLRKNKAQST